MLPAYLVYSVLVLAAFKRSSTGSAWRTLGAIPLALLLLISASLAHLMPIVDLPSPTGSYPVGTFTLSVTDPSRTEPFEPERSRELFVQAWYPAYSGNISDYPVRTLWQALYSGDYGLVTFFSSYLKHIDTHSHTEAPVAADRSFPLLVYNHGYATFTAQNTLLMEHLASHGYVTLAIGRPFDGLKVNLQDAGTKLFTLRYPPATGFQPGDLPTVSWGALTVAPGDGEAASRHNETVNRLLDRFR